MPADDAAGVVGAVRLPAATKRKVYHDEKNCMPLLLLLLLLLLLASCNHPLLVPAAVFNGVTAAPAAITHQLATWGICKRLAQAINGI